MGVTFFLPREADFERLRRLDPDRDVAEFRRGERVWILQSYLRLRAAGHPVELDGRLPREGLVVFHVKHRRLVEREWTGRHRCVLVGVRADNRRAPLADFEILQSDRRVRPGLDFHVPHWPQPGLLPRDPARGDRLERLEYKGHLENLLPSLRGLRFASALAERQLEWIVDAADSGSGGIEGLSLRWADYRFADLVLAVRPPEHRRRDKPASKLSNAWIAGVPALLGREHAFRALRRSELDYIEVDGPSRALAAIDRLRAEPGLYRAMIANGRRRAADLSVEAITSLWASLLFEELPALAARRRVLRWQGRSIWLRKQVRRVLGSGR